VYAQPPQDQYPYPPQHSDTMSPPPPQGQYGPPPFFQPPKKSHKVRTTLLVAVPAFIALIVLVIVLGSHSPSGLNNPATLAASVQSTYNTAANQAEDGFSVSSTSCIANAGGNTFTCIFTESTGSQQDLTVTVAANGESWISKADNGS
jgi:hypothetical protein